MSSRKESDVPAGGIEVGDELEGSKSHRLARGLLALLVLASPLVVCPSMFDLYDGSKRVLCHILTTLAFVCWMSSASYGKLGPLRIGGWHVAFVCFLISQIPGVLLAVNPVASSEEWMHRALWFVAFFLGSQLYSNPGRVIGIYAATCLGATLAAVVGLIQAGGIDFTELLPQVARPASTFGNKNMAAEYIALVIPLTLAASVLLRERWLALPSAAVTGVLAAYVLHSQARSTYLALALAVLTMILAALLFSVLHADGASIREAAAPERIVKPLGVMVLGLLASMLLVQISHTYVQWDNPPGTGNFIESASLTHITQHARDLGTYSVTWRFRIWANSLALAKDHLLFGVGLSNWKFWYPRYFDEVATDTDFNSRVQADTPHNDYLQYLGEAGLAGILGLCLLGASLALLGRALWVTASEHPVHLAMLIAMIGILVCYMITSFFSFPLQKSSPTFLLFVWLGVFAARIRNPLEYVPVLTVTPGRDGVMIAFYLLSLGALYVGRHERLYVDSELGFKTGYRLVNEGKVYDAWQALRAAHLSRPDNHSLSVFAGGIAMELGLIDEGLRLNQKAIQSHPYFTNAYNQLGNAHWRKKEFDQAEVAYRKSLEIHPTLIEPLRNLASLMLSKSKLPEAIDLLETLIKSSQGSAAPEDKLDLAEAYRLTGKLDRSRELYSELQTLTPGDVRVIYALGEIARSNGRLDEAVKQFRHVLTLAPEDPRAKLGLARTLTAMGKGADAEKALQEILTANPESESAQAEMAENIRRSGDVKGAIEMLQKLLEKRPQSALFHSKLAGIFLTAGDRQKASDHFQQAVGLDPRRMLDWARLGRIHVEAGNLKEANEIFESALAVDPNDRKILNEMGLVQNRLGQTEKAVEYFTRASTQPEVEAEVFFNLGGSLAKLNRNEEAARALRTFVALWRGDPEIRKKADAEILRLTGGP